MPHDLLLTGPLVADVATWITATGAIATAGAALVAFVALIVQLRALERQLRSSNYQQIVSAFDDFSKVIIDRPEIHDYVLGRTPVPADDTDLKHRVDWIIGMRFGWYESVVLQYHRYHLLSDDIAQHWLGILERELKNPPMLAHWRANSDYYHPDLRKEVDRILALPS